MLEKDAKQVTRMTHCRGWSHTSSPAKNILRRSFYFSFPMKQLETLLLPHHIFTKGWWHVEEDISVGLVGFGCTSLSARADVWTILGSMHFAIYRPWGGLPWWGYGTIGAQCSVRHFARVDNALMGLRCVELQYFAVLQRVDNALMEVATTTEVRPWHLRSLHPTPCPLLASTISSSTSSPTSLPTPSYVCSPNQTWRCIEFPNLRWKLNRNWG